ncbi:bifunctional 2-polyprenyl-6-hydroxyphenol methylase/3-demethylubiquinol 3-O-methyltransferase UbiG [Pseudorhodobacter sp. E13]|uniref:class I SAM-dependent methyltransferase n=1 Tax=Pseudorhodobacter sp. E13 TaxID=2487931 RepID=UPI001315AA38|nr:class I SAM-dependent methyltransferase [Pseudorhodobacter sp. E13]
MTDTFYRDFEAKFRGDPSLIRKRLRVYEPFLTPLAVQDEETLALDLGCGRGEWLETLADYGLNARGVDLDEGMLDVARTRGLTVDRMDALTALKMVPDSTLTLVSAFHLIEHLPFNMVREIAAEARRALRPGGILIFETPNPENPVVGLVNFHLDPTHIKPLPPALTSFVAENSGFSRNLILRLQGADPQEETAAHLGSILTDVSFDYAVVAQVDGPKARDLDAAFALHLGVDLYSCVQKFDEASAARIANVSQNLTSQHDELTSLRQNLTSQRHDLTNLQQELMVLRQQFERNWLERLLFRRSNGRPKRALRRMLFHKSGKPRGIFRNWIFKSDGRPRRAFRQWMNGPDYLALSWPAGQKLSPVLEPDENILAFKPHRPRPADLPENVMTIEELVTRADRSSVDGV